MLPATAGATGYTPGTADDVLANDAICSLREAIEAASTNAAVGGCPAGNPTGADSIVLGAATYRLTRSGAGDDNGDLDANGGGPLNIAGAGADQTAIAVEGAGDRVLEIGPGATVTVGNVTIRGGRPPDAPPAPPHSPAVPSVPLQGSDGGGVLNLGTLSMSDSVVTDNVAGDGALGGAADTTPGQAAHGGEGGSGGNGGGIYNVSGATLTLDRVRVSGNRAGAGG
ncbi:MAG: CSLREA domain-containing protein, partial [Actinomycetota bacterium]|nr:CSLREA domain-containing protein [Actinomycetota bacterium]